MIKAYQGIRKKPPCPLDAWSLEVLSGAWRNLELPRPSPFAPLRLCVKTPAIVPDQASSRHPLKKSNPTLSPRRPNLKHAAFSVIGCWSFDVGCWMFAIGPTPPIKAKNPVIVPHQASSRQTLKNQIRPKAVPPHIARARPDPRPEILDPRLGFPLD